MIIANNATRKSATRILKWLAPRAFNRRVTARFRHKETVHLAENKIRRKKGRQQSRRPQPRCLII